jgi:membrane-bound lytic murein transglycosylase B
MRTILSSFFIAIFILASVVNMPTIVFAADNCLSFDLTVQRSDDDLKKLLAICDAESKETETQLNNQKAKSSTIASDVALLDSLIKKAAQQIDIKNQIIKQLGTQITQKVAKIETLSEKLNRERDSLGQILRKKNEIDATTLTEMMLSNRRVSDFFLDVDNFETINKALQDSVNVITGVRTTTTQEKTDLEKKKLEQANLKNQIEADKKKTESQKADKNVLLADSKAQEKSYAELLAQKKAQAAKISAALFKFKGNQGIPFGDAYKYAKEASQATGVRPAFILAILKQESEYGKYDGGCVLADTTTAQGKRVSTGELIPNVMKPTRDLQPFLSIVKALGFNPLTQQFSCPMKINGAYSGYGGALGPSQFIPSTWVMFETRIEKALGIAHANPWNPEHAIMATALYMKDLGAQNQSAERDAACKYYSGRGCNAVGVTNAFYGNSVVKIATKIQADIDIIESAR